MDSGNVEIFPVTESCLVTLSISVCYERRRRAAIHDMERHAIHIYCILAVYKSCREFSGPEIPLVTDAEFPVLTYVSGLKGLTVTFSVHRHLLPS